ncbi:MAG: HAD family hydrolase [Planctomycetota bacterium]
MHSWMNPVVSHRDELTPIETDIQPKLESIQNVRSVVFDVYGTLLISGTGDVGSSEVSSAESYIAESLASAGIELGEGPLPTTESLHQAIRSENSAQLSEIRPKPEVDIVSVWRRLLDQHGLEVSTEQCNRVAAEYESRMNPTWPMPGGKSLLHKLSERGLKLGIVSNAQQFTIPLVEELAGDFGVDSLFDLNLCVFSCRYRQAKPAPRLFDVLCDGLRRLGMAPGEALYVGNDRLNDVWAASQAGLRTAWFAGDQRSLRPREDDSRVRGLPHDLILTQLEQLATCF